MSCPFVYVRWHDAEHPTTGEWIFKGDLDRKPGLVVETGGFLVNHTPALIQVAVSVANRDIEGEQYTGVMMIPLGCVQLIVELPFDGKSAKVLYTAPGVAKPKPARKRK